MAHISISFESQELGSESGQHLSSFLSSLKPVASKYYGEPEPVGCATLAGAPAQEQPEDKPKATRNRSKKVETVTEEVATPEEQAVANEVETVAEEVAQEEEDDLMGDEPQAESPTVTREQIRSKVSYKQAAHKDAIRAKLKDLGAENVTKLEDKHFGIFYAFLEGLK